jgi:hypothetical protein
MSLTPEALYLQLGSLVAEMPDLANGPITPDLNRWIARVAALIDAGGDPASAFQLRNCSEYLYINRAHNAQVIAAIVHHALAKAELNAPAAVQALIAAGHTFDALAAVSRVLHTAKTDVLVVDLFADEKVLTVYALLAPDQVSVRLLTEAEAYPRQRRQRKPHRERRISSLRPAAEWVQQFRQTRPPSVRLAAPGKLDDQLTLVDGTSAWMVRQSLEDLLSRSHKGFVRMDPQSGALKIAAYETIWNAATPL